MCMAFVHKFMADSSHQFSLYELPSDNGLMMEEQMNTDTEITKNLVKQPIHRCLKAVVDAKGYPTK